MEYDGSGSVFQHQVHIMGNQKHRHPLTVQLTEEVHDLRIVFQILTCGRFIQQNHLRLNRQGVTVVLITHDMHLMLEYTPRAIVFHGGRVIADKASAEVLNSPEIVEAAHLKETSLFHLAHSCGIDDPEDFTRRFIARDREVRG